MRAARYLRNRYRAILSYTGLVLFIGGVLMLTPLLVLIVRPREAAGAWGFLLPALTMAALGVVIWRVFRVSGELALTLQEGGVVVLLGWVALCLFSSWPFIANGSNFTQAVFESVSGWTTTGLTVVNVEEAGSLILLWRSVMQFAGGAGLAIIMLSAITGPTGPGFSSAEGREQLVPHVRHSAKLVMGIYTGYAALGIIASLLTGMGWFDAINHSFAAVSTGGFSTRAESIGYWNSPAIESVTLLLMVLGNLNFVTAWLLLRGKFRTAGRNGELRLFACLAVLCSVALLLLTSAGMYATRGKDIRVSVFQTVTALTTTGFSTVEHAGWNSFGWLVLIVLMVIGGGTCSTAGGIKQYRVYMLWKSLIWQLRQFLLPRSAVTQNAVYEGERRVFVDDDRLRQIGTFLFLYLLVLIVGSAILAAHGNGLRESVFEYASAIGTVGLSVGITGPEAPGGVLWAKTVGMFLGRLEFIVIIVALSKLFRDSRSMFVPKNRG